MVLVMAMVVTISQPLDPRAVRIAHIIDLDLISWVPVAKNGPPGSWKSMAPQ